MVLRLIVASTFTGIISGIFIIFYEKLIELFTRTFFFGDPAVMIPTLPVWYIYALPTAAIFVVNTIIGYDKNVREYGVNEIAESVAKNELVLKIKTLFLKVIASALSLSTGFAVGTEGPSAGIGAMIAYQIHKYAKLPQMLVKMMISVGASSGIAAVFVSPITGMAFAVENIAYQFIKQYITYLILASVTAFAISVNYLEPILFKHSTGKTIDNSYIIATLMFIPFITLFIFFYLFLKQRLLYLVDHEIFKKFHRYRNVIFSFIGGATVGTILLINPHAAFTGKGVVMHLINADTVIPFTLILTVIVLRIVGTTVAIYANAVGGIFLPLMSIGALVGYGFAEAFAQVHFEVEPFYFAAIGAAVFMGVVMKLPLTAVILAMETTFDYNVVIATGISVVLVEYLTGLWFDIRRRNVTKVYRPQENKVTPTEVEKEDKTQGQANETEGKTS